jgi:hypothetical protein
MNAESLWQRAQHGWPASYPIVQFPNPPLLVAAAGAAAGALGTGAVSDYGRATFYAGLAAWAWLELTDGANSFRRALGAGGLALVVVRVADALGA